MSFLKISDTSYINLSNVFSIAAVNTQDAVNIKMLDGSEVSFPTNDIGYTVKSFEEMGGPSFVEISDGSLFVDSTRISQVEQVTSSLTVIRSTSRANVQTVMSAVDVIKKIEARPTAP